MTKYYDYENKHTLTKEETIYFFKTYSRGNLKSREILILDNLGLVSLVVNAYWNNSLKSDLFSVGVIGLIKAVDTFSVRKNASFSTYATRCIQNEIGMYLRKIQTRKVSLEKWKSYQYLENSLEQDVENNYIKKEETIALYQALKTLSEQEKQIIFLYFGLHSEKKYTQNEIAHILNYSQSYVARLLKKALNKLKLELEKQNHYQKTI